MVGVSFCEGVFWLAVESWEGDGQLCVCVCVWRCVFGGYKEPKNKIQIRVR